MVRHVAVEEEVASQLLAEAGAALRLEVECFGRTDDFHVDPVCLRTNHGILHRPVPCSRPEVHVIDRPRAARPTNGPTVGMVRVEDFRSTVHQTELGRIAHIGTGNRRRGIAERIGAVSHRLVFEPEVFVLHMHVVDAERLAAIVDCTATRTIGVGQRITLRQEVALLIERAEGLVADFVIDQHKLAEVRTGTVFDDRLPTTGGRRWIALAERLQVARSARLDNERAEQSHHGQFAVLAIGMELADTFLGVRVDVPLELACLLFFDDRIRVRRGCRRAGGAHHHARPMDVQTDRSTALFQLVRELDLDAVTLVGAENEGLNPLCLHARNHGARIEPFLVAGFFVLGFFCAHLIQIFIQHVHIAWIEVEPRVERDLDIDRGHVVLLHRSRGRTLSAACQRHRFHARIGHKQHVLPPCSILVHHGRGVVHPGVDTLHLGILGHMLHDPLVLLFNHCRTLGLAAHRILDNRLTFEFLRPTRQLMAHRDVLRRHLPIL